MFLSQFILGWVGREEVGITILTSRCAMEVDPNLHPTPSSLLNGCIQVRFGAFHIRRSIAKPRKRPIAHRDSQAICPYISQLPSTYSLFSIPKMLR